MKETALGWRRIGLVRAALLGAVSVAAGFYSARLLDRRGSLPFVPEPPAPVVRIPPPPGWSPARRKPPAARASVATRPAGPKARATAAAEPPPLPDSLKPAGGSRGAGAVGLVRGGSDLQEAPQTGAPPPSMPRPKQRLVKAANIVRHDPASAGLERGPGAALGVASDGVGRKFDGLPFGRRDPGEPGRGSGSLPQAKSPSVPAPGEAEFRPASLPETPSLLGGGIPLGATVAALKGPEPDEGDLARAKRVEGQRLREEYRRMRLASNLGVAAAVSLAVFALGTTAAGMWKAIRRTSYPRRED